MNKEKVMRLAKNTTLTALLVCGLLAAAVSTVFAQENPTEPEVAITIFGGRDARIAKRKYRFCKSWRSSFLR